MNENSNISVVSLKGVSIL